MNPVAEVALERLTQQVNLASGLVHPDDKTAAVELFKTLRRGGEPFDAREVRVWAEGHGWEPERARELADVAERIGEGRSVQRGRGSSRQWPDRALAQWRKAAASR